MERRLRRWWCNKYKLPPNHELLLTRTQADLLLEWYEDLYEEQEALQSRLDDVAGNEATALRARLAVIERILGEGAPVAQDDLADHWDEEWEAGRTPDLDMMPDDLRRRPT